MSEERTELQELLAKEGHTGLTREERERALEIISKAKATSQPCWICKDILKRDTSKKIIALFAIPVFVSTMPAIRF